VSQTSDDLRAAVKERVAAIASSPDQERKFPVGPASAKKLGYDSQEIDALPPSVTESFCGVGNPLGLGEVRPGQAVLDLGSGPGVDSLRAARRVGPTGKVVGVDSHATHRGEDREARRRQLHEFGERLARGERPVC
jgi:hypothetical protein